MVAPGWLSQRAADVPAGDGWLGVQEREVLGRLRLERRRADWRLGRWTAKTAVGAWLSLAPARVQILARADGAPEAWLDGQPAPVSVSISHRSGRALAAVADAPAIAGCDLELIEVRSEAFIREWLTPVEQQLVWARDVAGRPLLANLMWTAKEAAAKVRHDGLRLDLRRASVSADEEDTGLEWRPVRVDWHDGSGATSGWSRAEPGWVMVIAGEPPPARPRALDGEP